MSFANTRIGIYGKVPEVTGNTWKIFWIRQSGGALEFDIKPVCVYSVILPDNFHGEESFGMLFFADIKSIL